MKGRQLPPLTRFGTLPPGEYELTVTELRRSHLVTGPTDGRSWARAWRLELIDRLEDRLKPLWAVEYIPCVFSRRLVRRRRARAGDVDGWFPCPPAKCRIDRGEPRPLQRDLNRVDPRQLWSWRREDVGGRRKLPMWHALRVELYYDAPGAVLAWDVHGNGLRPSEFFARTRSGRRKGVVKVMRDPN